MNARDTPPPFTFTPESLFLPNSRFEQHANPLDLYLLTPTTVVTKDHPSFCTRTPTLSLDVHYHELLWHPRNRSVLILISVIYCGDGEERRMTELTPMVSKTPGQSCMLRSLNHRPR